MSTPNPVEKPESKDPKMAAGVAAPGAGPIEDASTQALSDALKSSFRIVRLLMVVLVFVFLGSGVFTVNPNEVAIKLRFGKPVGVGQEQLLRPGLHWAFPYPIDEVVRVPVGQSHTVSSTIGWYSITPEEEAAGQGPMAMGMLRPGVDGYTLTADGNIIHAKATLKFRIRPEAAARYIFDFSNTTNLLQSVLDNALLRASAEFTAEGALYRDKIGFSDAVRARITKGIEDYQLGVLVETDEVLTSAPADVRQAFDEVLTAQQTARARVSEAESYSRGVTNNALGQASAIVTDGVTYSNTLVKTIAAEARRFEDQLPYYASNSELLQQRLITETMGRVLTNSQFKVFVPSRADGKQRELRLQLSREPEKPGNREGQQPQ